MQQRQIFLYVSWRSKNKNTDTKCSVRKTSKKIHNHRPQFSTNKKVKLLDKNSSNLLYALILNNINILIIIFHFFYFQGQKGLWRLLACRRNRDQQKTIWKLEIRYLEWFLIQPYHLICSYSSKLQFKLSDYKKATWWPKLFWT